MPINTIIGSLYIVLKYKGVLLIKKLIKVKKGNKVIR